MAGWPAGRLAGWPAGYVLLHVPAVLHLSKPVEGKTSIAWARARDPAKTSRGDLFWSDSVLSGPGPGSPSPAPREALAQRHDELQRRDAVRGGLQRLRHTLELGRQHGVDVARVGGGRRVALQRCPEGPAIGPPECFGGASLNEQARLRRCPVSGAPVQPFKDPAGPRIRSDPEGGPA